MRQNGEEHYACGAVTTKDLLIMIRCIKLQKNNNCRIDICGIKRYNIDKIRMISVLDKSLESIFVTVHVKVGKRGSEMLYYAVTKHEADNSYQKSQEQILTALLGQVGPGYTAARLQIMLRHTQASIPVSVVLKRPVSAF